MNKCISCKFNIDTGNVECCFADGTMVSVDCEAVKDALEIATFSKSQTELDWLVYNAPREYAQMVLSGELERYLRRDVDPHGYLDA